MFPIISKPKMSSYLYVLAKIIENHYQDFFFYGKSTNPVNFTAVFVNTYAIGLNPLFVNLRPI